MTVTTEDGNRQNLFAKEPPMTVMDVAETHNEKAEKLNGRVAMLGTHGGYWLTQSRVQLKLLPIGIW